jgi:hypothetical protein
MVKPHSFRERTVGKKRQQPTPHAEGEHGRKTQARNIEQLESRPAELPSETRADFDRMKTADGKRPLVEDREQHDEAEKNSEPNRRAGLSEEEPGGHRVR